MSVEMLVGHVLDQLAGLKAQSVHCVVTSVPYWGLRAYGTAPQVWGGDPDHAHTWGEPERAPWANEVPGPQTGGKNGARNLSKLAGAFCACGAWLGELGQEPTAGLYVEHIVAVFREVRRVLRADGTLWLNIGDSYAGSGKGPTGKNGIGNQAARQGFTGEGAQRLAARASGAIPTGSGVQRRPPGLKPKDLVGIPWAVAFALREDGWWLRQDIVWSKPNPMPESVRDRCTRAHEYIFLLTRAERYFYDAEAIKEPASGTAHARGNGVNPKAKVPSGWDTGPGSHDGVPAGRYRPKQNESFSGSVNGLVSDRNKRSVWTIGTEAFTDWAETVRQTPVALDAIDGDTKRTTSPTCPLHGSRGRSGPNDRDGVRGDASAESRRNPDTDGRRASAQTVEPSPTAQSHAEGSGVGSSDSPRRSCSDAATLHSSGSHRTDPDPSTTSPCTASEETASHTGDRSASRGSPAPDGSGTPASSGTPDRTSRIEACTCTYYREVTEKISHFATFPTALPELCIKAGKSERGCCPSCGAPWQRQVERSSMVVREGPGRSGLRAASLNGTSRTTITGTMLEAPRTVTIGWAPSCQCPPAEPVPCVVLDCFGGAGTTGLVADRLGRDAVLIELNPQYAEMARQRIAGDAPMFTSEVVS